MKIPIHLLAAKEDPKEENRPGKQKNPESEGKLVMREKKEWKKEDVPAVNK